MFDFKVSGSSVELVANSQTDKVSQTREHFEIAKRSFDIVVSLLLLPFLAAAALVFLVVNPFMNKGKLLFSQIRMGRDCKPFMAYKFRSMRAVEKNFRGADDPIESHRISWLGNLMRKSRVDELPQLINVLKGDMSLIGPRPDYIHHARKYLRCVPGYRDRHSVRPGISGLAQTELGYVVGTEATSAKVRADIFYINNRTVTMEMWIFYRTVVVVFGRKGA